MNGMNGRDGRDGRWKEGGSISMPSIASMISDPFTHIRTIRLPIIIESEG